MVSIANEKIENRLKYLEEINSDLVLRLKNLENTGKINETSKKENEKKKSEPLELEKSFKSLLKRQLLSLGLIGVRFIMNARNLVIQIAWILFMLLSISLGLYYLSNNISEFYRYDAASRIKIIYENPALFPSVKICLINPLPKKDDYKNFDLEKLKFSNKTLFNNTVFDSNYNSIQDQKQLYSILLGKWNLSLKIDEILLSCFFGGNSEMIQSCNTNDFQFYTDHLFGKCFVFNSKINLTLSENRPTKIAAQEGPNYGMQVEMYLPEQYFSLVKTNGVILGVANYDAAPWDMKPIQLKTGTRTFIGVDRTVSHQLPAPFSKCSYEKGKSYDESIYIDFQNQSIKLDSRAYFRLLKNFEFNYEQDTCFKYLFQTFIQRVCNCSDQNIFSLLNDDYTGKEFCNQNKNIDCYNSAIQFFYTDKVEKQKLCPLECHRIKYDFQFSYSDYPSKDYFYQVLKNNRLIFPNLTNRSSITLGDIKENVLSFNIYYNNLFYTEITEFSTRTWTSSLSQICGTLGFFIGISTAFICQLFEMIVEYFLFFKKKKFPTVANSQTL